MGNACGKNVKDQVKTPANDIDTGELDELERNNERLREKLEELKDELARWREVQKQRISDIEQKIEEAEEESKNMTDGTGDSSSAGNAPLQVQSGSGYSAPAGENIAAAEEAEIEDLKRYAKTLKQQLDLSEKNNTLLEEACGRMDASAVELEKLIGNIQSGVCEEVVQDISTLETERVRRLGVIADVFRPIPRPGNVTELSDQVRIDCAECSSQTVRNVKALMNHWKTGDTSWYAVRPLRGVMCNALSLGNKPHDPWNCDLCDLIDSSDIPLLT